MNGIFSSHGWSHGRYINYATDCKLAPKMGKHALNLPQKIWIFNFTCSSLHPKSSKTEWVNIFVPNFSQFGLHTSALIIFYRAEVWRNSPERSANAFVFLEVPTPNVPGSTLMRWPKVDIVTVRLSELNWSVPKHVFQFMLGSKSLWVDLEKLTG